MKTGLNTNTISLLHKTLDFRSQRQDLLASNIANMDTPQYRAEDLVFEKSLEQALHSKAAAPLQTTNSFHFSGIDSSTIEDVTAERIESAAPSVDFDGNTVDLDKEMAKISENQILYQAATKMLSYQFRMIKMSIMEGR